MLAAALSQKTRNAAYSIGDWLIAAVCNLGEYLLAHLVAEMHESAWINNEKSANICKNLYYVYFAALFRKAVAQSEAKVL